jgi:hypothetical protein
LHFVELKLKFLNGCGFGVEVIGKKRDLLTGFVFQLFVLGFISFFNFVKLAILLNGHFLYCFVELLVFLFELLLKFNCFGFQFGEFGFKLNDFFGLLLVFIRIFFESQVSLGTQLLESFFLFPDVSFELLHVFFGLIEALNGISQFLLIIFSRIVQVIVQFRDLFFGFFQLFCKFGLSFPAVNQFLVLAFDIFLQFFRLVAFLVFEDANLFF